MMDPALFRRLSSTEVDTFRRWAREHYVPGQEINPTWHPVVQHECATMNLEVWQDANGNLLAQKIDDAIDDLFGVRRD